MAIKTETLSGIFHTEDGLVSLRYIFDTYLDNHVPKSSKSKIKSNLRSFYNSIAEQLGAPDWDRPKKGEIFLSQLELKEVLDKAYIFGRDKKTCKKVDKAIGEDWRNSARALWFFDIPEDKNYIWLCLKKYQPLRKYFKKSKAPRRIEELGKVCTKDVVREKVAEEGKGFFPEPITSSRPNYKLTERERCSHKIERVNGIRHTKIYNDNEGSNQ